MMDENGEAVVSTTTPEKPADGVHSRGEPIQIVKLNDEEGGDHSFYLDEEALSQVMDDVRIRDKPLCIVSVAGKGFMLQIANRFQIHITVT